MSEIENNNSESNIENKTKKWSEVKGENSWTLFKVIAELVEGFEVLNKLNPCVSIFDSDKNYRYWQDFLGLYQCEHFK